METRSIHKHFSVAPQITPDDVATAKAQGFRAIICNRPDGEAPDQPSFAEIEKAAKAHGLEARYMPIVSGKVSDTDAEQFTEALATLPAPILAYCRSGTRCTTLWSLAKANELPTHEILRMAKAAGYDMSGVVRRIVNGGKTPTSIGDASYDVVIVGGGAAGIAVAASLLKRKADLDVVIIDPAETHYYQPGWTMVGAGIFTPGKTVRTMASIIPKGAKWIQAAVAAFEPDGNAVILDGCRVVKYKHLIVCPGLKLDWGRIEGLTETLGKNGVTSNYRYDLAPYTWELVQGLKHGRAVFSQPPMPIKCAGAPQKAMYLSADHWRRQGHLKNIEIDFYNAGAVLFGVKEYVPALMQYIERYGTQLHFGHTLAKVDGPSKTAWFNVAEGDQVKQIEVGFDMLHAVPSQSAPDFVKSSTLVDANGWIDVDQSTLRHKSFANIYSLGDVMNAPNAKTAAAARMQAPVVAANLLHDMGYGKDRCLYNGYGSCPLTVERGKIVLAEFGYGGKILNSFPTWLIDGTKPSRLSWHLKETILPPMYWQGMLKGREWMVKPEISGSVMEQNATQNKHAN